MVKWGGDELFQPHLEKGGALTKETGIGVSVRKENISREGVPMFSCFSVDTQGEFDKCAWRLGSQDVLDTRALSFVTMNSFSGAEWGCRP